jgi:hypothetical protein
MHGKSASQFVVEDRFYGDISYGTEFTSFNRKLGDWFFDARQSLDFKGTGKESRLQSHGHIVRQL